MYRKSSLLLIILGCFGCFFLTTCNEAEHRNDLMDPLTYVDPFIGTGGHGHTFPGATTPFGMVQLSPDTHLFGWDASSGYHYSDSTLYGFSHTHLSGTGIGDLGDVLFLPYTGGHQKTPVATFKKATEYATPGYYRVQLDNFGIAAELTASPRAGFHRYTYPGATEKKLMINLGHVLQSDWGHKSTGGSIEFINDREIKGMTTTSGWAYDQKVYFHMQFSSPFEVIEARKGERILTGSKITGDSLKVFLRFLSADSSVVLSKVGISAVSEDGALENLQAEIEDWNFEEIRDEAEQMWRKELLKIKVKSSDTTLLKVFYTALYHANIAPMLFQDIDGKYLGMDKMIHEAEPGYTNYTVFSLWDTFRAWNPLMTIINEGRSVDWINSLLRKYKQGGILPKWPLAGNYTGTMVGYPAVAVFADALTKGITGFDDSLALMAAVHSSQYHDDLNLKEPRAKQVSPKHLYYVEKYGYIPADSIQWSVSYGLEGAYYDWCIATMAQSLNNDSVASKYRTRSQAYKQYFDPEVGLMRGRLNKQQWRTPFSPVQSDFNGDFVEGNAWQWSWFVPHDIPGLVQLMGDTTSFVKQLDALFEADSELEGEEIPMDISGLIGQYAHGNEPDHHVTHLYNYVGQSAKTQEKVNQILLDLYTTKPDGIIGNEDCGQMSAWFIMNAMGFYQVCPGVPEYSIGRPLFEEVTIELEGDKDFIIKAINVSRENKYVQSASLNGKKLDAPFFTHNDIMQGGTLELHMTSDHE
ncbi:GH92 family glycosyl hydrolase [Fulvivirga sp. M361]|uniref:GH92 family glycosyl hydrolase n=1 Tax=Fulvivirga sp. M361 TaxID=2594266 RepID=UPI002106379E|nr:GH92 family glycosyl hydrolase [Fulvivirga sp. M361]